MKAVVQRAYGSPGVLELREIDKPAVERDEVLVRVRAAGVNPADWHLLTGDPRMVRLARGLRRPRGPAVLGADLAGTVEAVGAGVTRFRPGDEVFGEVDAGGGLAEYAAVSQDLLAAKPANLTFEQAAAVPMAGLTALQALRDHAQVQAGQSVLINGASGGVGTFAVQIAKALGAQVAGVCSGRNLDLVASLGADRVIDYAREDFTQGPQRYDVILDNVANHPLSRLRRVLAPGGTLITNNGDGGRWLGPLPRMLAASAVSLVSRQRLRWFLSKPTAEDLAVLTDLIEAGEVAPVIDATYPLAEAPQALAHVGDGHARGKVVVAV